ncbi:unnamed protein product [Amoebophrya sp. A120]|nr:unnamed protein product [Amoebophrya sp. A120]|eukprot:GSA120T00024316001.1
MRVTNSLALTLLLLLLLRAQTVLSAQPQHVPVKIPRAGSCTAKLQVGHDSARTPLLAREGPQRVVFNAADSTEAAARGPTRAPSSGSFFDEKPGNLFNCGKELARGSTSTSATTTSSAARPGAGEEMQHTAQEVLDLIAHVLAQSRGIIELFTMYNSTDVEGEAGLCREEQEDINLVFSPRTEREPEPETESHLTCGSSTGESRETKPEPESLESVKVFCSRKSQVQKEQLLQLLETDEFFEDILASEIIPRLRKFNYGQLRRFFPGVETKKLLLLLIKAYEEFEHGKHIVEAASDLTGRTSKASSSSSSGSTIALLPGVFLYRNMAEAVLDQIKEWLEELLGDELEEQDHQEGTIISALDANFSSGRLVSPGSGLSSSLSGRSAGRSNGALGEEARGGAGSSSRGQQSSSAADASTLTPDSTDFLASPKTVKSWSQSTTASSSGVVLGEQGKKSTTSSCTSTSATSSSLLSSSKPRKSWSLLLSDSLAGTKHAKQPWWV